jgi:ankyrin repeat protein
VQGKTAIQLAVEKGNQDMVMLLMSRRVSALESDDRGNTLLHVVARTGHEGICRLLVDREVRLYQQNVEHRRRTRYLEVPERRRHMISKDVLGRMPMEVARQSKQHVVEVILREGLKAYEEERMMVVENNREEGSRGDGEVDDVLDYSFAILPPQSRVSVQGYYSMVKAPEEDEDEEEEETPADQKKV